MPGSPRFGPQHRVDLGVDGAPQLVPQRRQGLRAALQMRDHVLGRDGQRPQETAGGVPARP